ncbi:MAG: hypothetical protein JWP89_3843 [Schlesneria sp.]|nr:hypothetical protein [Schlesneria sp.]
MSEIEEVVGTLDRLNSELQDLLVRGLRICGSEHLRPLRGIHNELDRIGATHLAGRLTKLISAIESDSREAAVDLLRTQASLRVFERVLTLKVAALKLDSMMAIASHGGDELADEGAE